MKEASTAKIYRHELMYERKLNEKFVREKSTLTLTNNEYTSEMTGHKMDDEINEMQYVIRGHSNNDLVPANMVGIEGDIRVDRADKKTQLKYRKIHYFDRSKTGKRAIVHDPINENKMELTCRKRTKLEWA